MMDYFIDHANYADGEVYVPGCGMIPLKRGQHIFGTSRMADFLGVARSSARRKLKILENIDFLTIQTTNRYSIASIINYDTYQDAIPESGQQMGQHVGQQPATRWASRWATHKERKKLNNIYIPPQTPPKKPGGPFMCFPFKNFEFPPWLNYELFCQYSNMRKQIQKPITTEKTITALLEDLESIIEKGFSQDETIQRAIDGCWLKFYPPRNSENQRAGMNPKTEKAYNFPKCPHCGDESSNIIKGQPCPWCNKIV
jgi:hypothetical protein